jgi:autotransporter-associated beta strand protein
MSRSPSTPAQSSILGDFP